MIVDPGEAVSRGSTVGDWVGAHGVPVMVGAGEGVSAGVAVAVPVKSTLVAQGSTVGVSTTVCVPIGVVIKVAVSVGELSRLRSWMKLAGSTLIR